MKATSQVGSHQPDPAWPHIRVSQFHSPDFATGRARGEAGRPRAAGATWSPKLTHMGETEPMPAPRQRRYRSHTFTKAASLAANLYPRLLLDQGP